MLQSCLKKNTKILNKSNKQKLKLMKTSLVLMSFCLIHVGIFCQPSKEKLFVKTAKAVIDAFSKQDSVALAKLIDARTGIYLLHRVGVFDTYNQYNILSFSKEYPMVLLTLAKRIKSMPVQYSALPTYDCDTAKWSKIGLFVDTAKTDHILSKLCENRNKYRPDTISNKTIRQFVQLEEVSRRIVLNNGDKELVFYLAYAAGRWYLVMIDTVTSDCSA